MREYNNATRVMEEVKKVVLGKDECISKALAAILAGGHILIEDIPGVGKTTLALALARSMGLLQHRVQFTPDVLPADIVGFSMYQKEQKTFVYQPGAVMCNLFLADEINRTSPKTQSALLEVMEEGTVTVDRVTREVPRPFIVIATENPTGSAGTQMLPESQLDRFMICMTIGYPDIRTEIEIVKGNETGGRLDDVRMVADQQGLIQMQRDVEEIFVHEKIYDYIGGLVQATRDSELLELGISPRGTISLVKMTKAQAYLAGRNYCVPGDVASVFRDVAVHRVKLSPRAKAVRQTVADVLQEILSQVKMPSPARKKQ